MMNFWEGKRVLITGMLEFLGSDLGEILDEDYYKELIKSLYFKEHIIINKVFLKIL